MTAIIPFDAASHLDSEEVIAEYLRAALEDGSPDMLQIAVRDIARARAMAKQPAPPQGEP